mgnify:CR=1 FL=1
MNGLIYGYGEVGQALFKILRQFYPTGYIDLAISCEIPETVDILHICFGYSKEFIEDVKKYQEKYHPKFTIIHSTVPVGTSWELGAIHSPISGLHPNLESGIKTFPKFLGGNNTSEVADYFRKAGLKVILYDDSDTTEAMKLFDTEYYKTCIEFAQRVKRYCDSHGLNFHEVYTLWNQEYNKGYAELGHSEFIRPILQPIMKPIGGHCLVPNSKLLNE